MTELSFLFGGITIVACIGIVYVLYLLKKSQESTI